MKSPPQKITLEQWDERYHALQAQKGVLPDYCGPLGRHVADGDQRLKHLRYDNSVAALRLWNFLLTEEQRLAHARARGEYLVGTMKDLGTVPVMVYALENCRAFYPDGAWWIPCVMEMGAGLLQVADQLGIDDSFCPVRAMLGAFVTEAHFPIPDLLTCSVGAVCDDFSAIAQRLEGMGYPIHWWEVPTRRQPEAGEPAVSLPGGARVPQTLVDFVQEQLATVKKTLEKGTGACLTDAKLKTGIAQANRIRSLLGVLRERVYGGDRLTLPALEMLIAEMLALHFCSCPSETESVLSDLLQEVTRRERSGAALAGPEAARVFWVNPVADLQVMNLLEDCQARLCGTEYLFTHALDPIPTDGPPLEALARMALADPMVGSAFDRAARICHDVQRFDAEAVVVSRIPGASHCAWEGSVIAEQVHEKLGIPVLEMEVSPVTNAMNPTLRTRLEALVETVQARRRP